MSDRPDERQRLLSEAMDQVARDKAAIREMEARRRLASRRRGLLIGTLVAFTLVAAWDAWMMLWRPPRLPPDKQQVCALMRTAGAVGSEVLGIRASRRRVPTQEELAYLLDDHLRYRTSGEGFVVTHTDGVHLVSYDGSQPVNQWMTSTGCTLEGTAR
jgi:hypothetical protein